MNFQKKTFLLIAFATIVRLIIASTVELANAEVYYWVFSTNLQLNYFDHPPIVAWLIRISTFNLLLHNELFVRLGAIICSGISTWIIFRIGTIINNLQTGWFAALLYTSSVYGSLLAGAFILPDSPQMVFWLSSILVLLKISNLSKVDKNATLHWCFFGMLTGLCIMCKVHGLFLWFGVAIYVLANDRKWLRHPGIYLSAIVTLIIISPIIIWNFENDFVTYKFHSSRISLNGAKIHIYAFIKAFSSEVLLTNPVNYFLIISSLWFVVKRKLIINKKFIQILLVCNLPLIIILFFISLFRETMAHWTGPAYSCLLILPAIMLTSLSKSKKREIPHRIKIGLAFIFIISVSSNLIINYFPGTLSEQKEGITTGTNDDTLDSFGWEEAGKKFDSLYRSDVSKGIMILGSPIIVTKWFPAAHIDFYFASKTKQQTIGIGSIENLHQYYWMNKYKKQLKSGDNAYYIIPSNLFDFQTFVEITKLFKNSEMSLTIDQYRSGIICKEIFIFRLKGYRR